MKRLTAILLVILCTLSLLSAACAEGEVYKIGDKVEDFTVTLTDGQEVSLYALLQEKKAVAINFWASWCEWCKYEFPAFETVCGEMSDSIGLLALSSEPKDTVEKILQVKEELGLASIPLGLDTLGLKQKFGARYYPTTVFIDADGVFSSIHEGAFLKEEDVRNAFAKFAENSADGVPFALSKKDADFLVTDGAGNPVQGVMMQVCNDFTCALLETDAAGKATYTADAGSYEVHVLMVPEGYVTPTDVFAPDPNGGTVNIVLEKK